MLKNGWSLCLPNARMTPIPKPRTQPAVATMRLTKRPPHWDASMPSPASLSRVLGTTSPAIMASRIPWGGIPPRIHAARSFTISGGFIIIIAKKKVNYGSLVAMYVLSRLALYSSDIEQ